MSRIVDNIKLDAAGVLNEVLPHAKSLDACVGYFNLRGWGLLREAVGKMKTHPDDGEPQVRLLVGMAIGHEQIIRQRAQGQEPMLDAKLAGRRVDEAVESFAQQLTWGVPTAKDEYELRALKKDLEDGLLQVKFYAREPLHAKLYIAHLAGERPGAEAIVGSSNFTAAGLSKQGELSLEETDRELNAELAKWFNDRWDDDYCVDVTTQLIEVLENSWARLEQPNPYLVYLRLAYELSRDARDGLTLDIPREISRVLLPHQESAVRVATKLLQRRGIAVIGDVVGLGKTLTGTAIAAAFGGSVLVIAPKNLVPMWKDHLERYSIPGRVMSLSMVAKELPELKRFQLVLIDESHNLRSRKTIAWNAIHRYITENDSKVVLLTATMFNAGHRDIGGQLGLKLETDESLNVRPEKAIAQKGKQVIAARTGGKLDTLGAFEQSEDNTDWQRLLSEFLVRRTRSFLEQTYGKKDPKTGEITLKYRDGTTYRFPKRIPEPLKFKGGPNDPNDRLAQEEVFDEVGRLTFARYQLGRFLAPDAKPENKQEIDLLDDLKRSIQTAAGFIRVTSYKRLTSSAWAFTLTIQRMIARNAILEYALNSGLPIPLGTFSDMFIGADDDDGDIADDPEGEGLSAKVSRVTGVGWDAERWAKYAEDAYKSIRAKNPAGVRWARPTLFNKEEVLDAVNADSRILQHLLDTYGTWSIDDDTKLRALAKLIDEQPPGGKVLVFSEYKDTVDYLAENLPRYTNKSMLAVSGSGNVDPVIAARRFAPKANKDLGGLPPGETEINVLLTTDVLSEGQNLQDAAIVVNWDLPWTIIKVVQRAGRVDRVGQTSPTIRVLSFLPPEGVNAVIKLRERLQKRLSDSAQILGGDERIFEDDITVHIEGLFDGTANLNDEEGEVDASSFALQIWEAASETDRLEALNLQPIVYSTKAVAPHQGPSVITYGRTDQGADLLVRTTVDDLVFVTQMEALRSMESSVTEQSAPALPDHLEQVARAEEAMAQQVKEKTMLLNTGLRKNLYEYLIKQSERIDFPTELIAEVRRLIDAVTANPLRDTIKTDVAAILRREKILSASLGDGSGVRRLIEMYQDGSLVDERNIGGDHVQLITEMGFNPNPTRDEAR